MSDKLEILDFIGEIEDKEDKLIKPIQFDLTIRTERKEIMVGIVNHLVSNHGCNFSLESNNKKTNKQSWTIKICNYSWKHNLIFIAKAIPDLEVDEDKKGKKR